MSRFLNWFVLLIILLVGIFIATAEAQEIQQDNYKDFMTQDPELIEPTDPPITPQIFRLNRDVPCTSLQLVRQILADRGQIPIVMGQSFQTIEMFGTMVIALNETTGEFSVVVVSNDQTVACNIYAGGNFRLLSQ